MGSDLSDARTLGGAGAGGEGGGWTLAEGETLGGYRVVKPLGKGGMGEVYLARHEQMGKLYALKLISPGHARDEGFRKRFAIEARVMADLEHPNIVRVHYMGDEGGRFFLTMDYVEGPGGGPRSLADLLAEKRKLPEAEARRIALDVARALEYAHTFGEGVVHRDLKPGNILIDAQGRARVSDFGLAKVMGDEYVRSVLSRSVSTSLSAARTGAPGGGLSQSDGAIMGTVEYMAPEQKEGRADARSDIFAFGLIAYRMLTGRRAEGRFALPSRLGSAPGWDVVIERTLAPMPGDRYASVPQMVRDIERASAGRSGRGGRRLTPVAVGVLAAVGIGGVLVHGKMARRERLRAEEARRVEADAAEEARRAEVERVRAAEEAKRTAEEERKAEAERKIREAERLQAEAERKAEAKRKAEELRQAEETARRDKEAKVASLLAAAGAFRKAGLLDKAGERLVEVFAIDADNADAHLLIADLRRESAAKQAEAERDAEYRKWTEKGFDLKVEGKFADAAAAYDEAQKHAPPGSTEAADAAASCRPETFTTAAAAAEEKGDLRSALAHYGEAAKLGADVAERVKEIEDRIAKAGRQNTYVAAMTKARSLVQLKKWQEAAIAYEEALKQRPGDREATRLLRDAAFRAKPVLDLGQGVTLDLVLVPAGEFMMGSPESEPFRFGHEGPQHRVRITKPFYMGKYEVTQGQYERVMGAIPRLGGIFSGAELPVLAVRWNDATDFCWKSSKQSGMTVRLPTEAEWEYACRAGTMTAYCYGDSHDQLRDYAWYRDNSGQKPRPVGGRRANAWGLHDMHGNVNEWCSDWVGTYPSGAVTDPAGPKGGRRRVVRGGTSRSFAKNCRSAARDGTSPMSRNVTLGFRVVVEAGE
ncbi:MAG: bifunctional serine/threonine-protein kinase/formylglycine-generating enzyme family protein [Planctomycetota bacterium]|jgi:formylglycine-generating enzyme required for sulfatase activity